MLLVCMAYKNYGQVFYSTNPEYLKSKTEQNNLLSSYRYNYPDTNITNEHNFFPRNYLGNIGLPSPNYIFNYGTQNAGFTFYQPPTQTDRFTENQVEYYRTKGPYAKLTGIAGSKQLQIFKMIFTTTFKGKVNITLKFNRYTSQGYYLRQQTYTNNFFLTSNYTTKNNRFGYYFFILNNSNKSQENGGIKDKVLTDSSVAFSKDLFQTNISSATRDNRETKAMFNPWFRLNKKSDSLTGIDQYLQFKSRLAFNLYRYKDDNMIYDKFYNLIYLDTAKTFDSSHVSQYSNEIDYAVMSVNKKFNASAGYKNEVSQVWQYRNTTYINHLLVGDAVYKTALSSKDTLQKNQRNFESSFNAQYVFAGTNSGNYKVESNSLLVFNAAKKRSAYLNVLYEKRNADYIYNNWISNHYEWFNNGYRPQDQLQLKLGVNLGKHISASVFYQSIFNYLYFDKLALPRQYNNYIQNTGAMLSYNAIFFKHLGVGISETLQNTSNSEYVRIPPGVTTAKLFYNANLFKNNMQLQIGGQIQLYQSFYGYSYMPATQAFYLQNSNATGTYPYLDVYLNARIRPVTVFLKIENVLQGSVGPNYSFVPGYYQPDRTFRFGISWMFFD